MVISLYFHNTLVIRFQTVRNIFLNENAMVILALQIIGSITEVLLSTTLLLDEVCVLEQELVKLDMKYSRRDSDDVRNGSLRRRSTVAGSC
jgi:hypothetical protein